MGILDKIREMIKDIQIYVANIHPILNAIVTSGAHGVVTMLAGLPAFIFVSPLAAVGVSGVAAVLYNIRELKQVAARGFTAPIYDHIADNSVPWLAVVGYALLVV